jgi:hypothetical protein
VTGYGLELLYGQDFSPRRPDWLWVPPSRLLFNGYWGDLFPWIKRAWAWNWPLTSNSSDDLYIRSSHMSSLVKHMANFIFTVTLFFAIIVSVPLTGILVEYNNITVCRQFYMQYKLSRVYCRRYLFVSVEQQTSAGICFVLKRPWIPDACRIWGSPNDGYRESYLLGYTVL